MRIVSLVPSATEALLSWGIQPIAVTRFCEQPTLPNVGGTKDPDVQAVVDLAPDLVVVCVEENRREDADALRAAGLELFVFDIDSVDDVEPQFQSFAAREQGEAVPFPPWEPTTLERRAFVPIWRRPWMTMHGATYGSSVLELVGIENIFADSPTRYPDLTLDEARARCPDVVVAPSEPYPFSDRHRAELESVAPVVFVDGKDLFWWGVRTPEAVGRLAQQLAHPPT